LAFWKRVGCAASDWVLSTPELNTLGFDTLMTILVG
jgi:hypothetical protein